MDFVTTWLWYPFTRLMPSRQNGAELLIEETSSSPLLQLPPELIFLIADMLPLPSAASLTLCNRRLSRILGPTIWASLRSSAKDVRRAFLSSLVEDLPYHFVCYKCIRLHRCSTVKWPRVTKSWPTPHCILWGRSYYPHLGLGYWIMFPHIQLAIKEHSLGIDIGFPLEAFWLVGVHHDEAREATTLLSVDAQIVSGELLLRSQMCVLLPWSRRGELLENRLLDEICHHTRMNTSYNNVLPDLVTSRLSLLESGGECRTDTMRCSECWMDYIFDAVDYGDKGFTVVVTRWNNLGAGLDPGDAKWLGQSRISMPAGAVHRRHPLGSIRTGFEGQGGSSLDDISAENEFRLFSRRKRRMMTQAPDGLVWKWAYPGSDWWYLEPSGPRESLIWSWLGRMM